MFRRHERAQRAHHAKSRQRQSLRRRKLTYELLEDRRILAAYTWNDAANTLVINLENDESLTISEMSGDVSFMLAGGDGAPVFTQNGGDTAPTGDGTATITFASAELAASVLINNSLATSGTNDVTFSGAGSLSSGEISVMITDADASGTIALTGGFDLTSTAAGGITLETRRNIAVGSGTVITTASGDIILRANQNAPVVPGNFVGIRLDGATIRTTGSGNISLAGRGGNENVLNIGIHLIDEAVIESPAGATGTITIDGSSGGGSSSNIGVLIQGENTLVSSAVGNIDITGHGGDGSAGMNAGVILHSEVASTGTGPDAATITIDGTGASGTDNNWGVLIQGPVTSMGGDIVIAGAGGNGSGTSNIGVLLAGAVVGSDLAGSSAAITVNGTGGGTGNGSNSNSGVRIEGESTKIKSVDGNILVAGTAGVGASTAIELVVDAGHIVVNGNIEVLGDGNIELVGDTIDIGVVSDMIEAGANAVTLRPESTGRPIDLGEKTAGSLGLTEDELNRIAAGTLIIGSNSSGSITVSDAIVREASTDVVLRSGSGIIFDAGSIDTAGGGLLLDPGVGGVEPLTAGTDATAAVSFDSELTITIDGVEPDTGYSRLVVDGTVDLTGVGLTVNGAHVPMPGDVFVIVVTTAGVTGTFTGLNDGDTVELNGVLLTVRYTETAVVLHHASLPPLIVDTLDDNLDFDFSTGNFSLREAVFLANLDSDHQAITFDPALSGGTIVLMMGELEIIETLTIDASALTDGITIDASGNDDDTTTDDGGGSRIFDIDDGDDSLDSPVTLIGLTLTGGDVYGDGGAIRSFENLEVRNSIISGNAAVGDDAAGGGIYAFFNLTLERSIIRENRVIGDEAVGGGIFAESVTIIDSWIHNNHAEGEVASGGGLFLWAEPDPPKSKSPERIIPESTIIGTTFSDNTADGDGGGIFSRTTLDIPLTIRNSTISGNTADNAGGGLFNERGLTIIEFSTITNNTADDEAGSGVATCESVSAKTQVYLSIIAGNVNSDVDLIDCDDEPDDSFESLGYNLIGFGNAAGEFVEEGDQNEVADPKLGPLDDNGGFLLPDGSRIKTHALLEDSPAIDAGDPDAMSGMDGVPLFDQRGLGFPRVLDGNADGMLRIDIGAFEAPTNVPIATRVGVWGGGRLTLDHNRNFILDPIAPTGDRSIPIGFASDYIFTGNFFQPDPTNPKVVATGFDKLAAFGRVGSEWRWLIDFTGQGGFEQIPLMQLVNGIPAPASINGIPVSVDFDGNVNTGDELGIFTGDAWHFDTDADFVLDKVVPTDYRGYPIVGDFNNDGLLDVMTYLPVQNLFHVDLGELPAGENGNSTFEMINIDGVSDFTFQINLNGVVGFSGARERPVAADIDGDGVIDLGMWVPDSPLLGDQGEWFFFLGREDGGVLGRIPENGPGVRTLHFGFDDFNFQFGGRYSLPVVGNFRIATPPIILTAPAAKTSSLAAAAPARASSTPTASKAVTPTSTAAQTPVEAVATVARTVRDRLAARPRRTVTPADDSAVVTPTGTQPVVAEEGPAVTAAKPAPREEIVTVAPPAAETPPSTSAAVSSVSASARARKAALSRGRDAAETIATIAAQNLPSTPPPAPTAPIIAAARPTAPLVVPQSDPSRRNAAVERQSRRRLDPAPAPIEPVVFVVAPTHPPAAVSETKPPAVVTPAAKPETSSTSSITPATADAAIASISTKRASMIVRERALALSAALPDPHPNATPRSATAKARSIALERVWHELAQRR